LERLLYKQDSDTITDHCLDIRTRLKISVEGNPLRKVYRGGQLENFEEIIIKDYHVVNEVVLDRGPSPFCIQIEIIIDG
jgi:NAD kinase